MRSEKTFLTIFILLFSATMATSQSLIKPNYALKSHETLEISKVEISSEKTVVYLTIENRMAGGSFCADRNIYIIDSDGQKLKLKNATGIPVCPDTYKFKTMGEKLDFVLTFPVLKDVTEWIDLIEDCSENCFSFYGVTVDNNLNRKIEDAFFLAENKEPANAMVSFIKIAEEIKNKNLGVNGLLYINIIKLAKETGNSVKAAEWYNKLKSSGAPGVSRYIKYLNDQGINY